MAIQDFDVLTGSLRTAPGLRQFLPGHAQDIHVRYSAVPDSRMPGKKLLQPGRWGTEVLKPKGLRLQA
jgi:hypothetical protein